MASKSLRFIGWKARERSFYLEGLPITAASAYQHWQAGTAKFLPLAAQQMQAIIEMRRHVAKAGSRGV